MTDHKLSVIIILLVLLCVFLWAAYEQDREDFARLTEIARTAGGDKEKIEEEFLKKHGYKPVANRVPNMAKITIIGALGGAISGFVTGGDFMSTFLTRGLSTCVATAAGSCIVSDGSWY